MLMRIKLPELLGDMSPYALAKKSEGRISMSTAYRLVRLEGRVKTFDADLLEALCDVLNVGPGELLERDDSSPAKHPRKRR
jgi:DNA-binding Xre family transcriptional regulator